ncbi:transcription/translation regulatory transformer protein RfaH [Rhodoferax aquaticus]|uniref:Transcription antitermination protein RfaH n=1 Tax=Rhodoferax aquaticus TaxID=2527691 RepID=A0A515ERD4_9BURK|nr:transcription/translation regulatory transformer protein RfaH [Rhodoferax aquaticus]QDL55219.1 transcription/translation regulatory transformer protein RfaH [Rhodoferax aquaticus]
MENWFLVHTKIRQELVAVENLERQGFECFLPEILVEKIRNGKLQAVKDPLFPRYLFIRLDTSKQGQSWAPIRSTTGVSRLVTFGNVPAKVSDELISLIRAQSAQGLVMHRHFERGEQVVVVDGPFAGLEAVYQMADAEGRVMVLLSILSKLVKMSIAPTSLRKVS